MTRLPDSTENNRERITEQEDQDIAREAAAEQAARFGESVPKTVFEILQTHMGTMFLRDGEAWDEKILEFGERCLALGIELGRAQGRAEKQKEWSEWLKKRMSEDPMAEALNDGVTWRRRHEVT